MGKAEGQSAVWREYDVTDDRRGGAGGRVVARQRALTENAGGIHEKSFAAGIDADQSDPQVTGIPEASRGFGVENATADRRSTRKKGLLVDHDRIVDRALETVSCVRRSAGERFAQADGQKRAFGKPRGEGHEGGIGRSGRPRSTIEWKFWGIAGRIGERGRTATGKGECQSDGKSDWKRNAGPHAGHG